MKAEVRVNLNLLAYSIGEVQQSKIVVCGLWFFTVIILLNLGTAIFR